MKYLHDIGEYFIMLKKVFGRMTKTSVLRGLIFKEIDDLIISSLGIVIFISFFIGGVVTIQT
ncbi:MAG: ABC transporter permease, partial [Mesonia sp.]